MVANEQRNTFRLLSYWNSTKDDKQKPDISDINISEIGDLWDFCFILDVSDNDSIEFQYFGSELIQVFERDYTGEKLEQEDIHTVLADISKFIDEVYLMEAPVSHCGEVTVDGELLRYRSLLAPLSDGDSDEIVRVIGTTNFRSYN